MTRPHDTEPQSADEIPFRCSRHPLRWIGRSLPDRPPTMRQVLKLWELGNIITIISVLFALACLAWAVLSM